jgi:hypothetical protein
MQNEKQEQILEQYKEEIEKIEQRYLDLFKKGEKGIKLIGQKGGSTRNAGYRAKREYLMIELLERKEMYDITPTVAKKILHRILGRKVDFSFLIKKLGTSGRTASKKSKISDDDIENVKNDLLPGYSEFVQEMKMIKVNIQKKYAKEIYRLRTTL